jgi:hypothetical protein
VIADRVRGQRPPGVTQAFSLRKISAYLGHRSGDVLEFADVVYRTDEGKSLQEEALELKEIVLRNGRKIR